MLVGSAPSELKLGSTTVTGVRRGAGLIYDSDVAAFQKASGASQVGPILALVDYLKAQSLWSASRFYPMKSAQNAGSGSTVYGLGGLTTNNMTLVNSPTWGSDGVTFASASSQYGTISDFLSDASVSFWWRGSVTGDGALISQYDGDAADRSVMLVLSGATTQLWRSSTGGAGNAVEIYQGNRPATGSTVCGEWRDGGGRKLFIDGEETSITLLSGVAQTSRFNATEDISVMGAYDGGVATGFVSGLTTTVGFIEAELTPAQVASLATIVNAL